MIVGVLKETFPGERRVALVPSEIARLGKKKIDVQIEAGAGLQAGYTDAQYENNGAKIVADPSDIFKGADILLKVRGVSAFDKVRSGQIVIGFMNPLGHSEPVAMLAKTGAVGFAMELMPRITRAQSMDALSSMANLVGYKAVLLGAMHLPKILPMMMTAAGTVVAARVFVMGAGVAGLQAIATAKRLGAVVEAYDVRPEVKEQVQSVGGKFVELPLDTQTASDTGGYAKEQSADFYKRQQELLTGVLKNADMVITTAAIPGRKAPLLVTAAMVQQMKPGSVVIDLAAETGGNCELTKADATVIENGVTILGPTDLASSTAFHASQLYARNISTFVDHLIDKDGALKLDMEDEIIRETLVCQNGAICHPRIKALA